MKMKLVVLGLAAATLSAAAHPEATLKSTRTSVAAGSTMPVEGLEFDAGATVQLVLRGALAEYELRSVTPGDEGTFQLDLEIPRETRPGEYRLVALASDGDVHAQLDVVVMAAAPQDMMEEGEHEMAGDSGERGGMDGMARADEIPIERSRAGIEWGVIGLLIGIAGGAGAVILRS